MKKIVFMGTPLFAVPILKAIFSKGYNIPLVYTQPPSKSNRGHKVSKSPIHKFCEENNLKVRTPENFNNLDDEKNILYSYLFICIYLFIITTDATLFSIYAKWYCN